MSHQLRSRIHQEVELIQRFAGSYGKKFDEVIARLNGDAPIPTADGQCLRLCVEAVNMVLSLQGQLARVLDDLSQETAENSQRSRSASPIAERLPNLSSLPQPFARA